ncbi:MAG: AI-2E family transporter [Spirochaetes bacterium]|nr:AI-2E family transporter [Spirochaetota bacterium]
MSPIGGNKPVLRFTVQDTFFFLILAGLSIAFYKVLSPFLVILFAAIILAHAFYKPFLYLRDRLRLRASLAALVTTLFAASVIAVPITLVTFLLSTEVSEGYQRLRTTDFYGEFSVGGVSKSVKQIPLFRDNWKTLEDLHIDERVVNGIEEGLAWLYKALQSLIVSTTRFLIQLVITLYLIYFFLLDGVKIGNRAYELLPVREEDSRKIFSETLRIVEATLLGTVVVGALEGTWAGFLFFLVGIPSPVVWGVVMAIFSMLPVVGSNTIIVPFAIFLLVTGHWGKALILLSAGTVLLTISTSILKPKIVGDRAGLHPAVIVLSTIGGVAWLGMVGFFIGPLIAALFIMVWTQYSERYKARISRLRENGK